MYNGKFMPDVNKQLLSVLMEVLKDKSTTSVFLTSPFYCRLRKDKNLISVIKTNIWGLYCINGNKIANLKVFSGFPPIQIFMQCYFPLSNYFFLGWPPSHSNIFAYIMETVIQPAVFILSAAIAKSTSCLFLRVVTTTSICSNCFICGRIEAVQRR